MKRTVVQNITKNRTSLQEKLMWFLINGFKVELWADDKDKLFIIASDSNRTMVKKWNNLRKIVTDLYREI